MRTILMAGFLAASLSGSANALQVTMRVVTNGDVSTYTYTVHNDTSRRIVSVRIGLDYLHGVAELQTAPVGWDPETGLAPNSASAPEGWTPTLVTEEESEFFNLEWDSSADSDFDIKPGATVSGFSVRVPKAATEYRFPQFDIVLEDATHVYGQVQLPADKRRVVRH
jgi:hypothetical protein